MRTDKIYIAAPTGCFFGENAPLRSRRGAIPIPQRRIAQTNDSATAFVNELNAIIKRYKNILAQQLAKKNAPTP